MEVPPQFNTCLGEVIRMNRKREGISQILLAERAGVTRRFIQELENGRSDISMRSLYRLSRALNTTVEDLARQVEDALFIADFDG